MKKIIRAFKKNPVTSVINISGLAISLALVIILSAYCYSELTTDHFHKKADRVYFYQSCEDCFWSPGILKDEIDQKIPNVEEAVLLSDTWESIVFKTDYSGPVKSVLTFASNNIFDMFSFNCVEGDLNTALDEPLSIVISDKLKNKLFGNEYAIGKTVKFNNKDLLTVRAVIEEPKENASILFESIASNTTRKIIQPNGNEFQNWNTWNFQLFVLLKENVDVSETCKSISSLFPKNDIDYSTPKLLPLKKLYFSEIDTSFTEYMNVGNKSNVMVLLLVAVLVLIVSLVNFVNISSAQISERIKMMGIKKIVGASKWQVLFGILIESLVIFMVSYVLSVLIIGVIIGPLSGFTGISFNLSVFAKPFFVIISLSTVVIVGILTSLFPSIKIARSNAVSNLKNGVQSNKSIFTPNSLLVSFQFIVAIVLIAFTLMVQKQIKYGSNLGFNKDSIVAIQLTRQLSNKKDVLNKYLKENPVIKNIAFTQYYPGKPLSTWGRRYNTESDDIQVSFNTFSADAHFFEILKLELTEGRFFDPDLQSDKGKLIVNETFVEKYSITNPIGFELRDNDEIIGIVKDFHFKAINQAIAPLVIRNDFHESVCLIQLQTSDFSMLHDFISDIKKTTAQLSPDFPVQVSFFDKAIEQMYQSELQFRRTFFLFSTCAIVMCCLGIFAMTMLRSQSRRKEVGVRKVNGAKIVDILFVLNKDISLWVVLAFVFAIPVSWFAINKWLENFSYKTEISWWIFAIAGILTLCVALVTISWQSWRAAVRNPVEALRYE